MFNLVFRTQKEKCLFNEYLCLVVATAAALLDFIRKLFQKENRKGKKSFFFVVVSNIAQHFY